MPVPISTSLGCMPFTHLPTARTCPRVVRIPLTPRTHIPSTCSRTSPRTGIPSNYQLPACPQPVCSPPCMYQIAPDLCTHTLYPICPSSCMLPKRDHTVTNSRPRTVPLTQHVPICSPPCMRLYPIPACPHPSPCMYRIPACGRTHVFTNMSQHVTFIHPLADHALPHAACVHLYAIAS